MNYSSMESGSIGTRVGILGGGQLARMLVEAAYRLGLRPLVLAGSLRDPAAQLCPDAVLGTWDDPVVSRRFLAQVEVVAFENEFVSCEKLKEVAGEFPESRRPRFSPLLGSIFQLQDKLRQKEILSGLQIPSAPFLVYEPGGDLKVWVSSLIERFKGQFVLKWAQLGYDGKGIWISSGNLSTDLAAAVEFSEAALKRGVPLFAEQKIFFKRELALIGCYSITGEFKAYPLVISDQKSGICRLVQGPATALGVSQELERLATQYAQRIAETLPLHGCFALELFETEQGELWVNELAPRVHNTGHYTLDAADTSQFENHWRALLGIPLGETRTAPAFAMLNLLGHEASTEKPKRIPLFKLPSRIHLHWYGKSELRVGRKLGHLNGLADQPRDLPALIKTLEECEKTWIKKRA